MAKTEGTTPEIKWVPYPPSLFSDESSFYGDEHVKRFYEERVKAFNPQRFWDIQQWNLQCIAAEARSSTEAQNKVSGAVDKKDRVEGEAKCVIISKSDIVPEQNMSQCSTVKAEQEVEPPNRPRPSPPRNIYEGDMMAKQLGESLEEFLSRLPPSRTTIETGPWIWIVDPYSPTKSYTVDYAGFKQKGFALLEEFSRRKDEIEISHAGHKEKVISQVLQTDVARLEDSILGVARSKNVVSGKWMLFSQPHLVDKIWAAVAKGTLEGKLGCSARVNTMEGGRRPDSMVCIYTHDFGDTQDVKRVLEGIKRLGLIQRGRKARPVYYKCDAYTYLDISSSNDYGLQASMYNSRDSF